MFASHCGMCRVWLQPRVFVSPYFSKEAVISTWRHKVYRIGIVGPFIQDNENKMFIS